MTQQRSPWSDYFNEPTLQQLREGYDEEPIKLFDTVMKKLGEFKAHSQKMTWYGDGWHWSISYYADDRETPLVIIIPNPEDLQLAMPLDRAFINSLDYKQIKKTIRDGLDLANDPFDTNWGIWTIESANILDDLVDLVKLRMVNLDKIAG